MTMTMLEVVVRTGRGGREKKMLPSELLRSRISGGKIRPLYVSLDPDTLALAEKITAAFREGIGKRKGELLERLHEIETETTDFKLVRGLSTLLERRSVFVTESELNPMEARMAVFKEASGARVSDLEERSRVLSMYRRGWASLPRRWRRQCSATWRKSSS